MHVYKCTSTDLGVGSLVIVCVTWQGIRVWCRNVVLTEFFKHVSSIKTNTGSGLMSPRAVKAHSWGLVPLTPRMCC